MVSHYYPLDSIDLGAKNHRSVLSKTSRNVGFSTQPGCFARVCPVLTFTNHQQPSLTTISHSYPDHCWQVLPTLKPLWPLLAITNQHKTINNHNLPSLTFTSACPRSLTIINRPSWLLIIHKYWPSLHVLNLVQLHHPLLTLIHS